MHADEFEIDEALVQRLIVTQFPQWAHLPLKRVPSAGTDNALYRLGEEMVVRLPRIDWAVGDVDKECEWLPRIAPFLPVSIPTVFSKGNPTQDYPWPWSVYRWLEGSNPIVGHLNNPTVLTHDLTAFIQAMHRIDLKKGPISNRGVPLRNKQELATRKALEQLQGVIDIQKVKSLWESSS